MNILGVLTIVFCLWSFVGCYTQEKVNIHFADHDLDGDGRLERNEYMSVLAKDDLQNEVQIENEYYLQLTELLYDIYDIDKDGALTLTEWQNFANDILDESTEQYKEIIKNPKLSEGAGIQL